MGVRSQSSRDFHHLVEKLAKNEYLNVILFQWLSNRLLSVIKCALDLQAGVPHPLGVVEHHEVAQHGRVVEASVQRIRVLDIF